MGRRGRIRFERFLSLSLFLSLHQVHRILLLIFLYPRSFIWMKDCGWVLGGCVGGGCVFLRKKKGSNQVARVHPFQIWQCSEEISFSLLYVGESWNGRPSKHELWELCAQVVRAGLATKLLFVHIPECQAADREATPFRAKCFFLVGFPGKSAGPGTRTSWSQAASRGAAPIRCFPSGGCCLFIPDSSRLASCAGHEVNSLPPG